MEETRDADHVVILDKGKIVCKGTPAELKSKYTHNRFVWYTAERDAAVKVLESMKATRVEYDVDHYNSVVEGNLTELIYERRDVITDYEIIKGSMDDVFLNLTGRKLGE